MKRKTKITIGAITLVVIITIGFFANYLASVQRYKDAISKMTFDNVDASNAPDGSYIGQYDVQFIYAKVEVSVKGGKITGIQLLEHRNERGKAAEGIEQEIVTRQRIDVDVIAGATNSSQVIKKAVDNALSSAQGN